MLIEFLGYAARLMRHTADRLTSDAVRQSTVAVPVSSFVSEVVAMSIS